MKTSHFIWPFLASTLLGASQLKAADSPGQQTTAPAQPAGTPYGVISRGAHEQVWERTTYKVLPSGKTIPVKHHVTELQTGLNYWDGTQFTESREEITILPNGGASASQGQHTAQFPSDIYGGMISMTTPQGTILKSQVVGLSYSDGANSVLIATITNSLGQVLPSGNQLIYTNAFVGGGITASVRYTYKKASFEQDILLESQLPPPERFGFSSNAILEVVTEFFDGPQPATAADSANGQADPPLSFGTMTMGRGRAFVMGEQEISGETPVVKEWTQIGTRQFLFEQIPLMQIRDALMNLPAPKQSLNSLPSKFRRTAANERLFPKPHQDRAGTNIMKMAQVKLRPGTVDLDYTTLNTSLTNYCFQADSTYFISGTVNICGTSTFEGGAALKFATNGTLQAVPSPSPATIVWGGQDYRPVIFTAKDDNSIGEPISGSTGSPSGYYGDPMLGIVAPSSSPAFTGFRMSYAKSGLQLTSGTFYLYDGQFVNCQNGIYANSGATAWLGNALFANVQTNLLLGGGASVKAQSATFDTSACLGVGPGSQGGSTFAFTNCIFANVTNLFAGVLLSTNGDYNGFYNSPYDARLGATTFTNTSNPFQTVGGGNYYLSDGCGFRDAGTTNISAAALAEVRARTTHPPILLADRVLSTSDITLYPQAQRDADAPDLGVHYDPIDFEFNHVYVTNAITVTIAPGTAIAAFGTNSIGYGLAAAYGSTVISHGTPTQPVRFVEYSAVQESAPSGWLPPWYAMLTDDVRQDGASPPGYFNCRFTDFSTLALVSGNFGLEFSPGDVRDCQSHGGFFVMYGPSTITNCLFERSYTDISAYAGTPENLQNSLFYGGAISIYSSVSNSVVANNLFDSTVLYGDFFGIGYLGGYNAFVTNCSRIFPTNSHDIILTNTDYRAGPLGRFYYPTNGGMLSNLINAGSTNASLLGLYHYTVMTNLIGGLQIKETNSIIDVGFHYVATDASGVTIDSDSDGIPDYLEDANGDGIFNPPDIADWNMADTDGDGVTDGDEVFVYHLNPKNQDTDGDHVIDQPFRVVITRPTGSSTIP